MNLACNLERSAFFFPDHPAISEGGTEISYRELNNRSSGVASGLIRNGVHPGDHIGLCAPNSASWLVFYFGVLKAGAVAVTLSHLLSEDELRLLVTHSRPKLLFTTEDKLGILGKLKSSNAVGKVICRGGDLELQDVVGSATGPSAAVDRDRTDTAAILYTGGTTGTPKGVLLSHENINVSGHNVAFSERTVPGDRALCFLPFNHVFGQMHIMNATILGAGCLEVLPGFDMDRILEATGAGRVTKFYAVPTVYARLLGLKDLKRSLGRIRYCFSAAASLAAEIVRQWKEETGLTIYEGYGMTESASAVTYNHFYRHKIGSIGEAVPGVEVQIRDGSGNRLGPDQEGEICIRGHNIMTKGYLNNPEETRASFWPEGWYRSGDVGVIDSEGYVYIVDRIKDMIITGGENVYPREIEDVLYARAEVEACAVVGFPDKEWGEKVTAFVVPKAGRSVAREDLKAFLKSRLSPFKVPKEFIVVSALPKSPAGKILKRQVKKDFLEGKLSPVL
jgi:long-chain acyl-CoA synthetase